MYKIKKELVVKNKLGLHARPAALFVQIANKFESNIAVSKDDQEVNGKSTGHPQCWLRRKTAS